MVSEQQKKILVIEDDEDIRTIVVTRLKRASCETVVAADGQDGLRWFYGDHPDLVVLDISVPVMDGWPIPTPLFYRNRHWPLRHQCARM